MNDPNYRCHHCQGIAMYETYPDSFTCAACGSVWRNDAGQRTDFFVSAKAQELGFERYNKHLREKINEDLLKLGDP